MIGGKLYDFDYSRVSKDRYAPAMKSISSDINNFIKDRIDMLLAEKRKRQEALKGQSPLSALSYEQDIYPNYNQGLMGLLSRF